MDEVGGAFSTSGTGGTTGIGGTTVIAGTTGGTSPSPSEEGGAAGGLGEGGAGGAPIEAECEDGERSCGIPGTSERRSCQDGQWVADDECDADDVCSTETTECVPIASACIDRTPGQAFCFDKERVVCNADLSDATREPCAEGCKEGACVPASCGDGKVQGSEECDDGNTIGGDGCTTACQWGPKELVLGGSTSCALFGNGWAKCWGSNEEGTLGIGDMEDRGDAPNEMGEKLPFIEIGGTRATFSRIVTDGRRTCGINDGAVWCWGYNFGGILGIESFPPWEVLTPTRVDAGARVQSLEVFGLFTCALLESKVITCWGGYSNFLRGLGYPTNAAVGGALGDMPEKLEIVPLGGTVAAIEGGGGNFCAVLESGAVECWGDGSSMLGVPDGENQGYSVAIPFGTGVKITSLAGGGSHSCALSSAGLKCWGENGAGQLGYGHTDTIGGTASELSSLPLVPVTGSGDPIVMARGLSGGTCVVLRSNAVKCWGFKSAALGQPALTAAIGNIGDAPNEMSQLGAIGLGNSGPIRSFDAGSDHACALFESGEIKCWGANDAGQLGLGHTDAIGDSEMEMGAALRPTILR